MVMERVSRPDVSSAGEPAVGRSEQFVYKTWMQENLALMLLYTTEDTINRWHNDEQ